MILPCRHRYVPYAEAAQGPNIVIDGTPNGNTLLPLSHWPRSGTPWALKGDTSVEVVFNYLDEPAFHRDVVPVSNDHFDEDGLLGLHTMIEPEAALERRALLIDAAHAGDFAIYRDRRAARIAFAVSRLVDRRRSPWDAQAFPAAYPDYCAFVYPRLLERIGAIVADVEAHRELWQEEDALLTASERALESGEAAIEERAGADLAVVTVPVDWPDRPAHRFTQHRDVVIHPMAVHNRTACNRIATVCGDRLAFGYRYESWVQMVTHRPPPRVDLHPLAKALGAMETEGRAWRFDGVEQITPMLRPEGDRSSIAADTFLVVLEQALTTGAPAWDPYDAEN
jgi:hypothetical protein